MILFSLLDSAIAIILKKHVDQFTLSSYSFLLEYENQEIPSCGPCGSGTSIMKHDEHVANAIPGSHPGSSVADVGVKTVESPNWANTTASPKVLATQTHFYQVFRVCFLSRISSFPNFSACHTNHFDVHIPCVQRGAINMWQRNLSTAKTTSPKLKMTHRALLQYLA